MGQMTVQQALQLAIMDQRAGRFQEAGSLYRQILAVQPQHPDAAINLGIVLYSLNQLQDSIAMFRQCTEMNRDWPEAWNNLGIVLRFANDLPASLDAFQRALTLRPDFADALSNLGSALHEAGRLDKSIQTHRRAIALRPDIASSHSNLANALKFSGNVHEAVHNFMRAIALAPPVDQALYHYYLGLTLLLEGDFERGFVEHEWRCQITTPRAICWQFPQARWQGADLHGKTILLHAEQGFGDTIQFCRYAPQVAMRGANVILHVQPELVELMRQLNGVQQVVSQTDALPAFDLHCPLLSLPLIFKTKPETIPSAGGYLRANAQQSETWRARLGDAKGKRRVGLAWAGRRQYSADRHRSLEPAMLDPLKQVAGIEFHSLQKHESQENPNAKPSLPMVGWSEHLTDFSETAALIEQLDLVIAVDTSVAHLAGAMGKPTWLLLPFVPDWRWTMSGETSPWYESMRLFRQPAFADWTTPTRNVVDALEKWAKSQPI